MLVDSAVYVDGRRTTPATLEEACRSSREPGKFAWVTLRDPTEEELVSVAGDLGFKDLALEDATVTHQRPKLERYDDRLFAVLKSARYAEGAERLEYGEIRAFVEPDSILTVYYGEVSTLGDREKSEPARLRGGPDDVFYEILERVVEGYAPVVEALENDMDEIEAEVFGGNVGASRRTHELSREVIHFHQATKPLAGALERLVDSGATGGLSPDENKRLRRIRDRLLRVTEQIEGLRDLLSSILDVNLAMVGVRQNDQMQKISAWGAIVIFPTLVAGIFGMNFDEVPWHDWEHGFAVMVGAMLLFAVIMYLGFKRSGWL